MTLALRARWVLPVASPPIRDGVITIVDHRVVAVGEYRSGQAAHDLGDVAILPALVNAHTHLEFSDLTEPLGEPGIRLPEWIRIVVDHRRWQAESERDLSPLRRAAIARGIAESARCGVGAIGEIATAPWFADILRGVTHVTVFLELLGLRADRTDELIAAAEQHLAAASPTRGKPLRRGLSPHAPYTVHPELLRRSVELSARRRVPLATHLAESRDELELLRSGGGRLAEVLGELNAWDASAIPRNSRPLDYLNTLSYANRALIIHGNYLADDEIAFLGQRADRMSAVYCPRTHAFFQHDAYPLAGMIAAGANVALGTDSRASNPDLSLLEEMRFVARQHRDVSPEAVVRLATINGARALSLDERMGTIEPGRPANLTIVDSGGDRREPYGWLLAGDSSQRIRGAVRDGRFAEDSGIASNDHASNPPADR